MQLSPTLLAVTKSPPDYIDDVAQTRVTICMGFVSFMILIWDHMITFGDEVEFIWKGHKGLLAYLFFLNRYLTPLGFIVNLFAYMSPSWTPEVRIAEHTAMLYLTGQTRCERFVRYEGSMTVIGINTTALMMLLRIYALYSNAPLVISGVAGLFLVELSVNAWLLSNGTAVIHNRQVRACTMVFKESLHKIAPASAWLPLLYDTVVLLLTIRRTLGPVRRKTAGKIARVLLRDGMLYYSVIFAVNLVLTIMILAAPQGLQNITAQLEYLLTVAMMSRITIHLRKQARSRETETDFLGLTGLRSRLRFTHPDDRNTRQTIPSTVNVTISESSVVHDDHGIVLGSPEIMHDKQHKGRDWYEMRPVSSVPAYPSRARLSN